MAEKGERRLWPKYNPYPRYVFLTFAQWSGTELRERTSLCTLLASGKAKGDKYPLTQKEGLELLPDRSPKFPNIP